MKASKKSLFTRRRATLPRSATDPESSFAEVTDLIHQARERAFQTVNTLLIDLYWRIGQYISLKLETAAWGEGIVERLAHYITRHHPDLKGFTRRNLFRMRQFYETYRDDEKVSPLVSQLSWTHNLIIFSRCKLPEEREFYLRLAVREGWSKRELERQINMALFERAVLNPPKVSALMAQLHPGAEVIFKDTYLVDFLNLPESHSEDDLQRSLTANLRRFLCELGRDFCFVGEQYLLQVGKEDFRLDLLFFHRGLQALVAFELKVEKFQPAHLGQLEFYLEALDRDVRKPHERPSIGVLLCASKDDEVVEYALNRALSPALIAEYRTLLPDKQLLQSKLREFYRMAAASAPEPRKRKPKGSG
jgi:predicted nuclease of restriction endonuclease-like (RecB) superfamily